MRYKRHLITILCAVSIFFALSFVYNKFIVSSNEQYVYVANKDIKRGNTIDISELTLLKIKNNDLKKASNDYLVDTTNLSNYVLNQDISANQIIINDILVNRDDYNKPEQDEECVYLKIKNSDVSTSCNISRDSYVNIYYTGKLDNASELVNNLNKENIVSGGVTGYITFKLLENAKIIGVYDKYGNEISKNNKNENKESTIDSICVSVTSNIAMMIYNLEKYGDFSLSLLN